MAETAQGKNRFILYNILGESKDAIKIAYQTNHETSSSLDVDKEPTKDGIVISTGQIEQSIDVTTYLSTGSDDIDRLKDAHEQDKVIEVWDIDSNKNETNKYPATYYQAYLTEISESSESEGAVEVDLTFEVLGVGQRGMTTVNAEQQAVIQYAFKEAVQI